MVIAQWQHVLFLTWGAKEGRDSLVGMAYTVPVSSTPTGRPQGSSCQVEITEGKCLFQKPRGAENKALLHKHVLNVKT